jgi:dTDP-glucose pyrophosphorylase
MHPDTASHTINANAPISACLELMGLPGHLRTVFVLNMDNAIIGSISDGDIRRGFLKGLTLSDSCDKFAFDDFKFITTEDDKHLEIPKWREFGITVVPLLDHSGRLLRILDLRKLKGYLPITACIMAGGFGHRLRPLTNQIPKPMLRIGNKPILEININRLVQYGVEDIYISVHYLKEQIMDYFGDGSQFGCKIQYILESSPLGTMGALGILESPVAHNNILLFNADLLSTIDLEEMYQNFRLQKSDLSIASIPYKVNIPFAVFDLQDHHIIGLSEKPTYTYYSNAGFYIFRREHLSYIPSNEYFNATDFAQALINDNKTVTQFPVLGYWSDIGSIEDFQKAQEDILLLDLD